MKTRSIYLISLLVIFVVIAIIESNTPAPLNWYPSYSMYDKIPYGDYVLYDLLPDLFPGKKITVSDKPLYTAFDDSVKHTNLVIINEAFEPDSLDACKLLNYVHRGNNAFIAAHTFWGVFADSLKITTTFEPSFNSISGDSISLSLTDSVKRTFQYKNGSVDHYFNPDSAKPATSLSKNSNGKDVYVSVKFGKGCFYLSTVPKAFTNYNALKGGNIDYITACLSQLPVADTYWDEHYKSVSHKASTPLRYILSNISLRYAYCIMLAGILLYLVFEGKRKQRIIPVITPLQNTSLDFTETIGRLYYEKGNNFGIAKKRINFLLDAIRTRFNMPVEESSELFYANLSAKTLIPKEEITELFTFIRYVKAQIDLSPESLLKLNNLIENFYRKIV